MELMNTLFDRMKGTIKKYGERFQSRLVATFGINYLDDNVSIPDVTIDHVDLGDFEKAQTNQNGQTSIFDDDFEDDEE